MKKKSFELKNSETLFEIFFLQTYLCESNAGLSLQQMQSETHTPMSAKEGKRSLSHPSIKVLTKCQFISTIYHFNIIKVGQSRSLSA